MKTSWQDRGGDGYDHGVTSAFQCLLFLAICAYRILFYICMSPV